MATKKKTEPKQTKLAKHHVIQMLACEQNDRQIKEYFESASNYWSLPV